MVKTKKSELRFINEELNDLTNKTIIVTGANSGIGLYICHVLLCKHAHIVMACRNAQRADHSRKFLLSQHPEGQIDVLPYNQSSFENCEVFVNNVIERYPDFYALVLNAGMIGKKNESLFEDSVSETIGTNFIATYYITELLQDFLNNSTQEHKIIYQGSIVARKHHYKKNQILNTHYGKFKKYNISKCGVLNTFKYFASKNSNINISYLYAEPGIANSSIIRNFSKFIQKVGYAFMSIFMHSPLCGSLASCLAVSSEPKNGACYLPRHVFKTRGLPREVLIDINKINNDIIEEAQSLIRKKKNGIR